jgi:hypothetical protein
MKKKEMRESENLKKNKTRKRKKKKRKSKVMIKNWSVEMREFMKMLANNIITTKKNVSHLLRASTQTDQKTGTLDEFNLNFPFSEKMFLVLSRRKVPKCLYNKRLFIKMENLHLSNPPPMKTYQMLSLMMSFHLENKYDWEKRNSKIEYKDLLYWTACVISSIFNILFIASLKILCFYFISR